MKSNIEVRRRAKPVTPTMGRNGMKTDQEKHEDNELVKEMTSYSLDKYVLLVYGPWVDCLGKSDKSDRHSEPDMVKSRCEGVYETYCCLSVIRSSFPICRTHTTLSFRT